MNAAAPDGPGAPDVRPVLRRSTSFDALALSRFRCSAGLWYQNEAEQFIRGPLAARVRMGLRVWLVERGGVITAVAAHDAQAFPGRPGALLTNLMVLAGAVDDHGRPLGRATQLVPLLHAAFTDMLVPEREPYCYTMVAVDNTPMRRFCARTGFTSGPVPSNPRYLFYTKRLELPRAPA